MQSTGIGRHARVNGATFKGPTLKGFAYDPMSGRSKMYDTMFNPNAGNAPTPNVGAANAAGMGALKSKLSGAWKNAEGYLPKWDASRGFYADKGLGVWRNLGTYANIANGVYQAGMLGKNLSDLGNENRSTQDLLTDLRFATMSDPMLLSGLDPASKLRAQRLLRGNKDVDTSANVSDVLGGALKGVASGAMGGVPGMIIGGIGGAANGWASSKTNATRNANADLQALYNRLYGM